MCIVRTVFNLQTFRTTKLKKAKIKKIIVTIIGKQKLKKMLCVLIK